ncbi:MFS transporter [Bacillus sp. WMMC1349]|uniref:MFS transporter n=1 Tax=Bacillus sp. WMMC1349 TaxID=2736254 RepID=UPI0015571074|nr:MFS transporter [Bacillus sp. WMMC1349]NPC91253.1 MFS transporter [Bacillus sp. WMMC1349]
MKFNKSFLFVVSNQFIYKVSENIYDLALPLIILFYTKSPIFMSISYALGFLAEFLVGYFGGSFVDSFNRKKILTVIAFSQAILISAIPILHSTELLSVYLLLIIAFLIDFLLALYGIAEISIIPEIVNKNDLAKANSYMQMSLSIAISVGPSLAGLTLTVIGIFGSLWITFFGFILLVCSLALINYKNQIKPIKANPKAIFKRSFEGLKYTWLNTLYRNVLIWNVFINLGITGSVLMVIFRLKEELSLPSYQIGIVYTLSALGGIFSGWILPLINKKMKSGPTLLSSSLLTAISLFGLFATTNWVIVGIFYALLMGSVALNSRLINILYQTQVPIDYLGRVISASRLISTILAPISVLLAGYLSKEFGSSTVFLIGSIIVFLTNIFAFTSSLRKANWGVQNEILHKSSI